MHPRQQMAQMMQQQPQQSPMVAQPQAKSGIAQSLAPMMQAMMQKNMMAGNTPPPQMPMPRDPQIGFNPTAQQFNRGYF